MGKRAEIIRNNWFMLGYVFRVVPRYAVVHLFMQALFGLFDVMWGILLIKLVVDAVTISQSFTPVLLAAGGYLLYGSLIQIAAGYVYEIFAPIQLQKLDKAMQEELFVKAIKMDYSRYHNPEFFNQFVWAASQTEGKAAAVLDHAAALLKNIITVSGILTALLVLNPLGVVVVLVGMAARFIITVYSNKVRFRSELESKPLERKKSYISRVFYLPDYAKELRTSRIAAPLMDDYGDANGAMQQVVRKYSPRIIVLQVLNNYVFRVLLMDGVYFAYTAYQVIVLHTISYGTFAAVTNGVWTMGWSLNNLIDSVTAFQKNNLYIRKLRGFLEEEPQMADSSHPAVMPESPKEIKLSNVSFTYENSGKPTLVDINMTIRPKEKIAIVGYNGAGKSTLIKLLLRLYDVTEGEIVYDSKNIKAYRAEDYRAQFGVAFQDFQLFAASLAENVWMDQVAEGDRELNARVVQALHKADFGERLSRLNRGLQTELTREFSDEGQIFSGGEAQKIAIARAFVRPCSVLILDEPSSALDPISEYNLNRAMLEAAGDKTVIFISHRLSTTRLADRIYMMEHGKIIESGSHDELMRLNGSYAHLFQLQAGRYQTA
ncbi:ABC transporter ATP-binding protein [Paenibacillus glycanilyticus]|uniref:ABC transporter ATP-binding protein n=1 Tax=Paenibacillus glycanilyticus TaxID=126569 RepID=A0ABQ6GJM8_9BACL|nr:ABC transporter ATP-binding protein [Paenibacillus glycanilyticus]GLX70415.1 ABC transporter ATP-binding protein [Paenibacillus glycanilyticus]